MGGTVVPPVGVVGAAVVAAGVGDPGGAVDAGGVVGGSTAGFVSVCSAELDHGITY